ncbi:single-stranded-DNA-specific exonuclease RecJ [Candidatus Uhrbacteria bacterium]|nr:single-stranded-DNA-specific exonuclease RecJ [Candidatus Uhrbacteria bacterium]
MERQWVIAPRVEDDIVRQLLANRGVRPDDGAAFLSPDWERGTHSPWLFTKMRHAVDRVFAALANGERIMIHGDYDADGVSGSALLYGALQDIAKKMAGCGDPAYQQYIAGLPAGRLGVFLPDREKDGYGVAMHTVERLAAEGTKLLLTVDCGIANADQLDHAHELGVDVVICDHHQLGDRLPAHAIMLHPLAPGEEYPNKVLCGTGVAFKLASALFDEARKRGAAFPVGYEKWMLDLVAVATVTDVMPLLGENRVLEHFGLTVLRKTKRPGLLAILASAGVDLDTIDTETIGFRIGPRLNAAGRLTSASHAFDALAADDMVAAQRAAATLETLNRERQGMFAKAYDEARAMVDAAEAAPVLVVWKDDWLPGIVGLIAGRLVGDYGVPAFAFARVGGQYVGSGRSVGGLHLVEAMNACGDMFVRKGGHPQACGLTIADESLVRDFQARIGEFARTFFGGPRPAQTLPIDVELPLEHATWELLGDVARCAPFGEGNRAPIFAACGVSVLAAETMGNRANHLRLSALDGAGQARKLVGFGFGEWAARLHMGDRVDVAYTLEVNIWNGRRELQLRIVDLRV